MLIGHQKQWEFLKRSFQAQKLSHGYLFSGPEAIGKKTLAIEFTKFIHCQERDVADRPCNLCSACRAVPKGIHPDALLLGPKISNREIQISQIRDLIYKLSLKPFLSSCKTAIIDKAHQMNKAAQNCLLKTLEEPKGNTLLVLIAEHAEILSETIRSRLQEIKFFPVSEIEIEKFLKNQGFLREKAKEVARISLGRAGKAMEFLRDSKKLQKEKSWALSLSKVLDSDIGARFQYAKSLSQEPLGEIFDVWLRYFRETLLFKTGNLQKTSISDLNNYSLSKIKKIIEELEQTNFLISTKNINKRLALEILMMQL